MTYFLFTFLFNVPGLSNPFASSSAPAASNFKTEASAGSAEQSDSKRLRRRVFDASNKTGSQSQTPPTHPYRKRPLSTGPLPARLVRKRGWQPYPVEPSRAAVIANSSSGIIDTGIELEDMSDPLNSKKEDGEEVELDLPPSKRRKGLAESVISTAFNAALVGAAVGLTVFRLWKDRGKEAEQSQSPPPPYQEEWANPLSVTTSESEPTQSTPARVQKPHASTSLHKRHGGSIRHRQKTVRRTVHIRRDKDVFPRKPFQHQEDDFAGHSSFAHRSGAEDDTLDEMDWIGDRLAQLIEEGKRALGKEIVVASEAPEDEVDDGSGNWVEEDGSEPEGSTSMSFSSPRRVLPSCISNSKSLRYDGGSCAYSLPTSASSRHSTFRSHSRFHSDDLSASLQSPSIPNRSNVTGHTFESTYDADVNSDSPSIRESMERARAAYLQKHGLGQGGLGIDAQGTRN